MLGFSQSPKKSIPLFPLFYTLYLYTLRQKVPLTKTCGGLIPEVWAGLLGSLEFMNFFYNFEQHLVQIDKRNENDLMLEIILFF